MHLVYFAAALVLLVVTLLPDGVTSALPQLWNLILRGCTGLISISLFLRYARVWGSATAGIPDLSSGLVSSPPLEEADSEDRITRIITQANNQLDHHPVDAEGASVQPNSAALPNAVSGSPASGAEVLDALDRLAEDVVARQSRLKVVEEVELYSQELRRKVTVHTIPSFPATPNHAYLVLSMREKGEPFSAFTLDTDDAKILSFSGAQALCMATFLRALQRHQLQLSKDQEREFARMFVAPRSTEAQARREIDRLQTAGLSVPGEILSLAVYFSKFRPLIVKFDPASHCRQVAYSYSESPPRAAEIASGEIQPWLLVKERLSRFVGSRTNIISISTPRAQQTTTYEINTFAPKYCYIADSYARFKDRDGRRFWLPNLDRERFYGAFTAVQIAPNRSFTRWNAVNMAALGPGSVELVIHVLERPWGRRGTAALVSLLTLFSTWVAGLFAGRNATSFDSIAIIAAVPALSLSIIGLRHGWRVFATSLTAFASLVLSFALSLSSIVLYLVTGIGMLGSCDSGVCSGLAALSVGWTIAGVADGIWLGLALIALVNSIWSTVAALAAQARFAAYLRREPSSPK